MPHPKVKISDDSGNAVGVTSNRLDVNAYLNATPTIDIGDVSLLLGGTAASVNNGAADATTLRVTIASDTTGVLSIDDNGGSITVDGTVDLGTTDNAVLDAIAASLEILDDWDDSNYANVNLNIAGTDVAGNAGTMSAQTLRVTLATDDILISNISNATHAEDSSHSSGDRGVLSLGVRQDDLAGGELAGTDGDYSSLLLSSKGCLYVDIDNDVNMVAAGIAWSLQKGFPAVVVRNDELVSLWGVADGDLTNLQVNSIGGLFVTGSEVENAAVQSEPLLIGGRYDSSARTLGNGDAGAIALNASGHVLMDVVDGGQLDTIIDTLETTLTAIETDQAAIEVLLTGMDSDTDAIKTAVEILDNAISGSQMQVDLVSGSTGGAATIMKADDTAYEGGAIGIKATVVRNDVLDDIGGINDGDYTMMQVDAEGALYTTHGITGLASDDNADVGTTAEKISGADGDVACKRVDIMAHRNNTGDIWVGDNAVTSNGANGGIPLGAGDFYSIDIDNTGDVYVVASVNGEKVHFNYFT